MDNKENMIHISGDYYIGADSLQFIIFKKYTPKSDDGKEREPYYVGEKFCTSLKSLLTTVINMGIREDLTILSEITKVQELIDTAVAKITELNNNLK